MLCPKCQAENADTAEICIQCGEFLSAAAPPIPKPPVSTAPPPSPSGTAAPSAEARTSGMAITALVLGICSLFTCGITIIPAIIFGIVALVQINGSRGSMKGQGMAIAGLVIAVVLIPIIAIFAAILFPVFSKARDRARRPSCISNQQQIALAIAIYSQDHGERLPESLNSIDTIPEQNWRCDSNRTYRYGYNSSLRNLPLGVVRYTTETLLTADGSTDSGLISSTTDIAKVHQGGFIASFVDGHVEYLTTDANLRLEVPMIKL